MTGQECFENDPSAIGASDRKSYRTWDKVPPALQRWWQDRAELPEFGGPLDWNAIKKATTQ